MYQIMKFFFPLKRGLVFRYFFVIPDLLLFANSSSRQTEVCFEFAQLLENATSTTNSKIIVGVIAVSNNIYVSNYYHYMIQRFILVSDNYIPGRKGQFTCLLRGVGIFGSDRNSYTF